MGNFNLAAILQMVGVSDVIDIAIISYIFYRLLRYVRTTRVWQLAKGLIILMAAFLISSAAHFYVVNWLLKTIMSVGLIALVIVFQPELRRALEYLGRRKIVGFGQASIDREKTIAFVQEIVRSIGYFSKRKEGALIVIERGVTLNDVADTGTIVDAQISESIIDNIFYKGSPLHDGAAIIRDQRLFAAGCVLPLTENTNLSKDLGTRHRAGIGISEASDALVLIVSEETGIISMAEEGKLTRFLDLKTVEKTLLGIYLKTNENDDSPLASFINLWKKVSNGSQESN